MKKKNIIIIIIVIVIVGLVAAGFGVKSYLENNLNKLVNMPIEDVDLSKIPDGTYKGSYNSFPVAAEVDVTVANHKITKIDLIKHDNGQGQAAEILPSKVVESQTLKVDIISGATYSSKVILKAIENALTNAAK